VVLSREFTETKELCVDVVIGARGVIFYNSMEIMVCQMESTLVEAGSAVVSMTPALEGAGWVQKAYREANVVDDEISEEREKSMKSSSSVMS